MRVGLAIAEAVGNAVEHAPETGPLRIRCETSGRQLEFALAARDAVVSQSDYQTAVLPVAADAVSGRGLFLIRELTDALAVTPTELVLTFAPRNS